MRRLIPLTCTVSGASKREQPQRWKTTPTSWVFQKIPHPWLDFLRWKHKFNPDCIQQVVNQISRLVYFLLDGLNLLLFLSCPFLLFCKLTAFTRWTWSKYLLCINKFMKCSMQSIHLILIVFSCVGHINLTFHVVLSCTFFWMLKYYSPRISLSFHRVIYFQSFVVSFTLFCIVIGPYSSRWCYEIYICIYIYI